MVLFTKNSVFLRAMILFVTTACLSNEHVVQDPRLPEPTTNEMAKAEQLYSQNCKSCHGESTSHQIADVSYSAFIRMRQSSKESEGSLVMRQLTDADTLLLHRYLKYLSSSSPGTNLTGVELYVQKCAVCHLQIDISTVKGKSIVAFDWALSNIQSMKSFQLTELQKISVISALGGDIIRPTNPDDPPVVQPPPPPGPPSELIGDPLNGAQIYSSGNLCVNCHGNLAVSNKRNTTLSQLNWAIENISTMSNKTSITSLSEQDRVDLIAALNESLTPPVEPPIQPPPPEEPLVGNAANGRFIYAQNNLCVNCHGTVAATNKRSSTITQLNWAIANVPSMAASASVNVLTEQERLDLIAALNEPIPVGEVGSDWSEIQLSTALPVHDRLYTYEFLGRNFLGPEFTIEVKNYTNTNHRVVNNIITVTPRAKGNVFGGACTPYDLPCSATDAPNFRSRVNYSVLRRGYIESTCEKLISNDPNTRMALTTAIGSDPSAGIPDRPNVTKLAQHYLMAREDNEIIDGLMAIADASRGRGQSNLDQWRAILLTLCKSPQGEIQ